jgi:hypothetical protein
MSDMLREDHLELLWKREQRRRWSVGVDGPFSNGPSNVMGASVRLIRTGDQSKF